MRHSSSALRKVVGALAAGALVAATLGEPLARIAHAHQAVDTPAAEVSPGMDDDMLDEDKPLPTPEPMAPDVPPTVLVPGPAAGQPGVVVPGPATGQPGGPGAPPPLALPPGASNIVDLVVADAAQRVTVSPAAIRVISVQATEWPDASLGCGPPGMAFAQVVTPGFLIVVDVGGTRLTYHTDVMRRVVACDHPPGR